MEKLKRNRELEKIINGWRGIMNNKQLPISKRIKASELLFMALGGFDKKEWYKNGKR